MTKEKEPLIDANTLKQIDELQVEGMPDIIVEVIDSFLKTSPRRIEVISTFAAKHDIAAISKEAHALKSSARTLGAKILGDICEKLEDRQAIENLATLTALVSSLNNVYKQSCKELIDIRERQLSSKAL